MAKMRTVKERMKSLVVINHGEILLRKIVEQDNVFTVGNHTCDIPLPDEERILFAVEVRKDEEMAHIYMHERMALQVNGKRYEQGLIDIEPNSEIQLENELSIVYITDEMLPEQEEKPEKKQLPIVEWAVTPIIDKDEGIIEKKVEEDNSDTETVETEKEDNEFSELKPKSILDYFPKKPKK